MNGFDNVVENNAAEALDKEKGMVKLRAGVIKEGSLEKEQSIVKKLGKDVNKRYRDMIESERSFADSCEASQRKMMNIIACVEASLKVCEKYFNSRFDVKSLEKLARSQKQLEKEDNRANHVQQHLAKLNSIQVEPPI